MEKDKTSSLVSGDFENKLAELQSIVGRLENDQGVTLEDSIGLYESGLKIAKGCVDDLTALSARIAELNKQLDLVFGGNDEN